MKFLRGEPVLLAALVSAAAAVVGVTLTEGAAQQVIAAVSILVGAFLARRKVTPDATAQVVVVEVPQGEPVVVSAHVEEVTVVEDPQPVPVDIPKPAAPPTLTLTGWRPQPPEGPAGR